MFFQITSMWQIFGWFLVFAGLIVLNEIARGSKKGGIATFLVVPGILTVYFIVVNILGATGVWASESNWTWYYMDSWFHYAKLYAATIGCIGFMMIKYGWGIGKEKWFKPFPFVIVAINILIAVASDFESAIKGAMAATDGGTAGWWLSSEGVMVYGGWWNWVNGIAGIINIACMTGWWGIYTSKDKKDMLWPDMTWVYIVAYDVWNFEYTYNNLPTHAWYCGLALLLAPTVANLLWNKGGWIQNRANTLAIWCMFAQVVPYFQDGKNSVFAVFTSVYPTGYSHTDMLADMALVKANGGVTNGLTNLTVTTGGDNGKMQGVIAVLALFINVLALMAIVVRSIRAKHDPYRHEIFCDQADFKAAMARKETAEEISK